MNERPILFSGEMVRAILDGRKRQTRRVVKLLDGEHGVSWVSTDGGPQEDWLPRDEYGDDIDRELTCPYGKPGDRLWVKESWAVAHTGDPYRPSELPKGLHIYYEADESLGGLMKRSPLFMPRAASRITLEITDVRVERVQEITEYDAICEGIPPAEKEWCGADSHDPVQVFCELWDSINGKRGYTWESNPYVWVITFERITP